MNFTPGPWHVEPEEWTNGRGIAICADDAIVAIIDPEIAADDEDKANARLIAAAPELLATLVEMTEEWAAPLGQIAKNCGALDPTVALYPALQRARAAIAKATKEE